MKKNKIILTGGAGFIGSVLLKFLNNIGIEEIIIVDHLDTSEKWKNLRNKIFEDYIDKKDFLELLDKNKIDNIRAIIHLGACSSTIEKDSNYLIHNNYKYSKKLCSFALYNNIRFIYASSAATYGDGSMGFKDDIKLLPFLKPLNIYGFSKHLFDLWLYKNKLFNRVVGLKFFNVYGPNEYHKGEMRSVVNKAYLQIKKEKKIKLFKSYKKEYKDGEQKRDFIYVKDVAKVILFFLENIEKNGLFNVGTSQARSWNELAKVIFETLNIPINIEYIDMPEDIKKNYQYFTQANINKLREAGYIDEFTPIEEGVKEYINNYLEKKEYI